MLTFYSVIDHIPYVVHDILMIYLLDYCRFVPIHPLRLSSSPFWEFFVSVELFILFIFLFLDSTYRWDICLSQSDPMDSVCGIFQARILEGIAIPFSKRSS